MEYSNNGVSVYVHPIKKSQMARIVLSFPINGCWCCLDKLKQFGARQCCTPSCSSVALCYALFKGIRGRLGGDLLDSKRTGAKNIECSINNGMFNIYWSATGNLTSVKKTVKLVLSELIPAKKIKQYKYYMDILEYKSSMDGFWGDVANVSRGLKSVSITIIGKIKITDKTKFMDSMTAAVSYLPKPILPPKGRKIIPTPPKAHKKCDHGEINITGWKAHVFESFLSKTPFSRKITDGGMLFAQPEIMRLFRDVPRMANKITPYVSRMKKLGPSIPELLANKGITDTYEMDAVYVKKLLKSKINSIDVKKSLLAIMKKFDQLHNSLSIKK